jgi:hypothetical protein
MAIRVEPGPAPQWGPAVSIGDAGTSSNGLNAYPYGVAPDGQRFLINMPTAPDGATPITVVLNWWSRLKK